MPKPKYPVQTPSRQTKRLVSRKQSTFKTQRNTGSHCSTRLCYVKHLTCRRDPLAGWLQHYGYRSSGDIASYQQVAQMPMVLTKGQLNDIICLSFSPEYGMKENTSIFPGDIANFGSISRHKAHGTRPEILTQPLANVFSSILYFSSGY